MTMRERMRKAWAEKRDEYAIYTPAGGNKPCELIHEATEGRRFLGTYEGCVRCLDDICADAALAAMREPTNPMEYAAVTWVCDGNANGTNWIDTADFMKMWALAIDAARNESDSGPKSTQTDSKGDIGTHKTRGKVGCARWESNPDTALRRREP